METPILVPVIDNIMQTRVYEQIVYSNTLPPPNRVRRPCLEAVLSPNTMINDVVEDTYCISRVELKYFIQLHSMFSTSYTS